MSENNRYKSNKYFNVDRKKTLRCFLAVIFLHKHTYAERKPGVYDKFDSHMQSVIAVAYYNRMIQEFLCRYEGIQRVETYPYPDEALREAIFNAVAHKQYSSGIPIQISVYSDKMYIYNNGKLPEEWTIEKLFSKHPSQPYNPLIAYAFFIAGYIESWGRGIGKICEACLHAGLLKPEYDIDATGIMLKLKAIVDWDGNKIEYDAEGNKIENTPQVTPPSHPPSRYSVQTVNGNMY